MQTRDVALLFGISILLRGLLLAVGISQQGAEAFLSMPGDSGNYVSAAVALLNGEGAYERTFFAFGPGYSIALLAQMWIFGVSGVTLLIINVLFSSLACILIYRITLLLGFERPVAFFAGLAAAFSPTAITLSCILLSDTTYLFLLSATLTLFLSGLKENRRMKIVSAGALLSFAILTRSIGQMMPLVLLILFMLSALKENLKPNEATRYYRSRWVSVALCLALPIVTMSVWMSRNYHVNSHAVLSFTAVGAPARVAAITLEDLTGKSESAIRSDRASEYQKYIGKDSLSLSDVYSAYELLLDETWRDYPWEMVWTYLKVDWRNWNEITYLHHAIAPQFNDITMPIEGIIKKKGFNYLPVIVALCGFLILIKKKRYRTVLSIAIVYYYYALLIGFYGNQGSRYFLPAQVVEATLFGVVVTALWAKIGPKMTKLWSACFRIK